MAAYANIVLRDDAATPADHILKPVPATGSNTFGYREALANVPVDGQIRLTGSWARLKNGDYKVTAKLEVPVLETIGAANSAGYVAPAKVAYTCVGIFTMFAPARSSIADRANLIRMCSHVLSGATPTAGQGLPPTSATGDYYKTGTAASHEAFIQLIFPN